VPTDSLHRIRVLLGAEPGSVGDRPEGHETDQSLARPAGALHQTGRGVDRQSERAKGTHSYSTPSPRVAQWAGARDLGYARELRHFENFRPRGTLFLIGFGVGAVGYPLGEKE
jgi:hypothetical protein